MAKISTSKASTSVSLNVKELKEFYKMYDWLYKG